MTIELDQAEHQFVFPFRIAHGLRTHTEALFVRLNLNGLQAMGEATFPPYLAYRREDAMRDLEQIDLTDIESDYEVMELIGIILDQSPNIGNAPLAAIEMALWSLKAQINQTTVAALLDIPALLVAAPRTYTIAIGDKDEMRERLNDGMAKGFSNFKLKLDGARDEEMILNFRTLCDLPFAVDCNQSWTNMESAKSMAVMLKAEGCILIEQPFQREDTTFTSALRDYTSLPIIADEACQTLADLDSVSQSYSGINVKLHKCGGLYPGYALIQRARDLGLKVLIGCMSESAIGCDAARILAPLCDWDDLDGAALIR